MSEYGRFALSLAREAGMLLKKKLPDRHAVRYKGEIDLVTEADLMSEALIIERIKERFPDHNILSEESSPGGSGSDFRWIVDPLDGTTNYAHGFPVFCVSLALEIRGEVQLGVVFNPMLNEMFTAEKGRGAFLNRKRLRVSGTGELNKSLLATGFPYNIRTTEMNNIDYFNAMVVSTQAVRRAGSAALDMAYVAAGRFDGFWELGPKPWDTAAGLLLVAEAGGMVSDMTGSPYDFSSPNILCSNGMIHGEMIGIFAACDEKRSSRKS